MHTVWHVLRCAGKDTVELAQELEAGGLTIYVPRRSIRVRVPRRHAHVTKISPVLSTFLFVHERDIEGALALIGRKARPMLIDAMPVIVSDADLSAMRQEVSRRVPQRRKRFRADDSDRPARPTFEPGELVTVNLPGFSGYIAKVVGATVGEVRVEFDNFFGKASFSSFLLSKIVASGTEQALTANPSDGVQGSPIV